MSDYAKVAEEREIAEGQARVFEAGDSRVVLCKVQGKCYAIADVCTHGATVGQVDEEQMFYLRSRGLSEAHAQRLIVEGFFEPLMDRIPLESARQKLREAVQEKLGAF